MQIIYLFLISWSAVTQLGEALHYNPKVEVLITDGVTGVFYFLNPSGRTMALGLTQPLSEMSTKGIPWGRGYKSGRFLYLTT
jgi:hypothetical protein